MNELPLEIWYMIGNHIEDYRDMVNLSSICKDFRSLFNNHTIIIKAKQNTTLRWDVYCEDEDKNHTIWSGAKNGMPNYCPIHEDHEINISKTTIIDRVYNSPEKVSRLPSFDSKNFIIHPGNNQGNPTNHLLFNPIQNRNYELRRIEFTTRENSIGDSITGLSQKLTVGVIIDNLNSGDRTIRITDTSIQYLKIGLYVEIIDGINTADMGRILSIDGNIITTENESSVSLESGAFVRVFYKLINNYVITNTNFSFKINKKWKAVDIIMEYTNNSDEIKYITCIMEYLISNN